MGGSAGTKVVVGLELGEFWDWSKLGDEDISNLLSHVVELVGTGIGDDVTNISVDFGDVHDGVGESFFEKSDWVLEDGSPDFDSFDIWGSSFAVNKISIDGTDHLSNDGDTLDNISNILLFEISNGLHEINLESFSILEAWCNIDEFIVLNKSIKESSHELNNIVVVELGKESRSEKF